MASNTNVGTLHLSDLAAYKNVSVNSFGLDRVTDVVKRELAAHNQLVNEQIAQYCEITTDSQRGSDLPSSGEMVLSDEYSRVSTKKAAESANVAFPLYQFQQAIGWTAEWFDQHTPADMAKAFNGVQLAHIRTMQTELKKSLYRSANYSHRDQLNRNVTLSIKRFYNADGDPIPDSPGGTAFSGSTHTHYTAAALSAANLTALISNVLEHGGVEGVQLVINGANEAAVRALTGFNAYMDPRLAVTPATTGTPRSTLDIYNATNRAIGLFGAAEVWVKPWAFADYAVVIATKSSDKPLAFRERSMGNRGGLYLAASLPTFPLYAEYFKAEFGIAANARANCAVLDFTGGGIYTDPL